MTGSYLAEHILNLNKSGGKHQVHGVYRYRSDMSNISRIRHSINLHDCELRDAHNVERLIEKVKPDKIFHLAATSFVRTSFDQPADIMINNTVSQINVLEAVRRHVPNCIVQIAGTSEEYGDVKENEVPIKETNPLRPLSPYGVSKVAQEQVAVQYNRSYGLKTVITRTFNHTSPRRTAAFVESNFCKQVAEIEWGLKDPVIHHGNLDSVRDYTDARDIAKAYWIATEKCDYGEPYNICSGTFYTIQSVLDMILALSEKKIKTELDSDRLRPSDVVLLHGDYSKFKNVTGWEPKISMQDTIEELLNTWRFKIKSELDIKDFEDGIS